MLRYRHQIGKVCNGAFPPILLLWVSCLVEILLLRKVVVELLVEVLLDHWKLVIHQRVGNEVGLHQSLVGAGIKPTIVHQRIKVWLQELTIVHEAVIILLSELVLGLYLDLDLRRRLHLRLNLGRMVVLDVDLVLI